MRIARLGLPIALAGLFGAAPAAEAQLTFSGPNSFPVATNPDRFCPLPGGRGEPDCAAIIAAVEACTGVRCEANTGKPKRYPTVDIKDHAGSETCISCHKPHTPKLS